MLDARLYLAQRLTALIMAPLVLTHIVVIIYAVRGGLSASEILARTQGSILWLAFYGTFVVAVSVHAAIGLRVIAFEMLKIKGAALSILFWGILAALLYLGFSAVYAVTFAEAAT